MLSFLYDLFVFLGISLAATVLFAIIKKRD